MNKNHLIIFNTIVMNVKTIITIILSFITSRYVLELLGVESYGLYYLIAGITATFEFLCNAMISTTSRYFTMAQANPAPDYANIVFNTIRITNQRLIYIILAFLEVFGLIMVFFVLKIPEGMLAVCLVIFEIMIVDTYYKLKVIPYNALLTAKENFLFINIISVSQSIAKLLFVLLLFLTPDYVRLVAYSITILLVSFIARYITQRFVSKKYNEANIDKTRIDMELKNQVFSFLKYSWVGQLSNIFRNQGTNFLLNIFTGTVTINAAYGVSKRVTAVTDMAFTPIANTILPQTLKSHSEENFGRFKKLTYFNSKLGIILSWIVIIPLFIEADFVLDIWLKEVPEYAVLITRLTLISELIRQLFNGLSMSFLVSDKVKKIYVYQTVIRALAFVVLVAVLLLDRSNVFIVFYMDIIVTVVYLLVYLFFMKVITGIDAFEYIKKVIIPSCFGGGSLLILFYFCKDYFCFNIISNIAYSIIIVATLSIFLFLEVLSKTERTDALSIVKSFIIRYKKNKE